MAYKVRPVLKPLYGDPGETLDRLSHQFGAESIRSLVERFAIVLRDGLATLDSGGGSTIAHRVAGIAGTLGFAEVGQAWLALADGNDSDIEGLRQLSMRGLAIIEDRYAIVAKPST